MYLGNALHTPRKSLWNAKFSPLFSIIGVDLCLAFSFKYFLLYLGFDEAMNVCGKPGNSDYHLSDPPAKSLRQLILRCH